MSTATEEVTWVLVDKGTREWDGAGRAHLASSKRDERCLRVDVSICRQGYMSSDVAPPVPSVFGLRGATTASADEAEAIVEATTELLRDLLERNRLEPDDIVSIVFTATPDLSAEFPAVAARNLGLSDVPLLCASEMAVPGAPARCIRVLLHVRAQQRPAPLYLRGARSLRPDLDAASDS